MKRTLLLVMLLIISRLVFSQAGDFLVIRKNGHSVKTIFGGSMVTFRTTDGEWFNGRVERIDHDSIFFREVIVRQVGTPWGVARLDTMTTFIRKIHYNEVAAIPRRKASFTYIKNGSLLMIGAAGYLALNLVNSSSQHYSFTSRENLKGVYIAGGAFGVGKLLHTLRKPYLFIGKKYSAHYIASSPL